MPPATPGKDADRLRLYLFGPFRIERGNKAIRLPARKLESLLSYIVMHPSPHSRENLAALCWGDFPDAKARASLRNALATLRKQLGQGLILAGRNAVQLNPDHPLWVDALVFELQATRLLNSPTPDPGLIDLDLYSGALLADFYDDWILAERERLQDLYVEALLRLAQEMRARSEYRDSIQYAQRALAVDAANERAHQHLIFCFMALGERGAALKQYEACRRALEDELAVEPSPETKALYRWIRQEAPGKASIEASISNLPIPLTSFVGRQRETAEVKHLLSRVRLLTLTGAGGSGKTRLAIQVATGLLDAYQHGVWWVDLAALVEESHVPRTVAKALGVSESANQPLDNLLVNFLRSRQLLMVLDNCEHLSTACAKLAGRLLGVCPRLTILATSRKPLGCDGEYTWYVSPLSIPDPEHASLAKGLLGYESARLFLERAVAVNANFAITQANANPVAQVCRRLDGMPLALELAAARVRVLSVEQIASRLDDVFRLLTGGSQTGLARHQTLRAAIDWSYDLLSQGEQTLLRRLAVFSGGWTLQAAEAVCAGDGIQEQQVFELLSRLVDQSLVEMQEQGGEARYRMLQTIQQYSRERLLDSGESTRQQDRHLAYFLALAEAARPHLGYFLSSVDMETWLGRLDTEYDNLRAALHWCLEKENGAEAGLRLAGILHWFWVARAHLSEGRNWLAQLLALEGRVSRETKALALLTFGYMACWQGDFASGRSPLEEALAFFRSLEDGRGIAFAHHGLGFVAMGEGDPLLSRSLFEKSVHGAREVDDKWLIAFSEHFLAIVLSYQGEYTQAISYFEEGNEILEQFGGHAQGLAFSFFHLARIARLQGDYPLARSHHEKGMELFRQIGDRRGIGYSLAGLAALAGAQEDRERAACLSGAVASLQEELGSLLEAPLQVEYDQQMAAVRSALGEDIFQAAWEEGRAMSLEQSLAYALQDGEN